MSKNLHAQPAPTLETSEDLLRAFISSETGEFGKARAEIAQILRTHRVKPIYWEKLEKPSALSPKEFYLQYLETCQLYIGLFGTSDSPGTEDEYKEAVTVGLERWVFIKDAPGRGTQIQHLIQLAEKEVVREKFTTDQELQTKVDERIQNWLSQATREYLELRKQRTHAFLVDYRTKFLEPLLEQVQIVRTELKDRQPLQYADYWRPEKIKNHPHYHVDPELKDALETFFTTFTNCELSTAPAAKAFEEICKAVAAFHLVDYVTNMTPDAKDKVYLQVVTALDQTPLMFYQTLSELKEDDLSKIAQHAGKGFALAVSDPTIHESWRVQFSLRELVKGVVQMNEKNETIRNYLSARAELEKAANRAHELLWAKFVESAGYRS